MSRSSPKTPRLRADLIAGPHPEEPSRFLVHCPRTGQHFQTSADGWALAQLFDGKRTFEQVQALAPARLGLAVEVAALQRFAGRLDKLGAVEGAGAPRAAPPPPLDPPQRRLGPVPSGAQLRVHPAAHFSCEGFGTCCESGYVIPLSPTLATQLRQASLRILGQGAPDPVTVLPTEAGQPWRLALDNERGCPFLDPERRCRIHEQPEQPDPCRVFPFAFVRHRSQVYATVTHRCLCGQDDRGEALSAQLPALARRLEASRVVPSLPPRTQVDDHHDLPTGAAIKVVQAATLVDEDPYGMVLRALASLRALAQIPPTRRRALPSVELAARLAGALEIWEDEAVWAALRGEPHPLAASIRRAQRMRGPVPRSSPQAEAARFVRDHLYGLRIWEASTLARGLLTLAVALHGVLHGLPRRQAFSAARLRIMLQEDALTSSRLRGLYGEAGPLGTRTADLAWVERQVEVLAQ